jgi:radical SAM protein with 4Fe4S-binding SPASM domain
MNIKLIDNYTLIKKDKVNLLIFPDKPAWIVLKNDEFKSYQSIISNRLVYNYDDFLNLKHKNRSYFSLINKIIENEFIENPLPSKIEEQSFPFYAIHYIATHQCNMKCKHCYMKAGTKLPNEISYNDVKRFFNMLIDVIGKPLDIVLSGGEILTISWINELLNFLRHKKCIVDIYTNGLLLKKDFLLSYSDIINQVQISCEGVSKDTYGYIRGEKNYNSFLSAIELLASLNFNTKLAYLIMPHNFHELTDNIFISFLKKYAFDNLSLKIDPDFDWEGRAIEELDVRDQSFYENKIEDIVKYTSKILDWYTDSFNKERIYSFISGNKYNNCGIGLGMGIGSDGSIYPCFWEIGKFGNIKDISYVEIEEILKRFDEIQKETSVERILDCKDCELKYICCGGCKAKNLQYQGDYIKPICNKYIKDFYYYSLIYKL